MSCFPRFTAVETWHSRYVDSSTFFFSPYTSRLGSWNGRYVNSSIYYSKGVCKIHTENAMHIQPYQKVLCKLKLFWKLHMIMTFLRAYLNILHQVKNLGLIDKSSSRIRTLDLSLSSLVLFHVAIEALIHEGVQTMMSICCNIIFVPYSIFFRS